MKRFVKIFLLIIVFSFCLSPVLVFAEQKEVVDSVMGQIGAASKKANLEEAISPQDVIVNIIRTTLSFLGIIFVGLVVYGGFLFITAHGEEDQITSGKKIVIGAVVGLIIILLSYSITLFFGTRVNTLVSGEQTFEQK